MTRARLTAAAAVLLTLLPFSGVQAQTSNLSLSAEVEAVFDLAKQLYPDMFPGATKPALGLYEGYTYRFYQGSGIYVGVKDNEIWLMGGPFGSQPTRQGTVAAVKTFLDAEKIRLDGIVVTDPDAEGEYDLTITGSTTITLPIVGSITTQLAGLPVVQNIKAPDPSDKDEIEDVILDYFEEVGTIRDLVVVIKNNSSNRVTLELEFKATVVQQGQSVDTTYDLVFDYVK